MAYLLDIAVILIVVASVFVGMKRGFLKSVIGLVALLASLLLAFVISLGVATGVYSAFIQHQTENAIASGISGTVGAASSVEEGLQKAVEHLPGVVQQFMDSKGLSAASLSAQVNTQTGDIAQSIAVTVTDAVVRPVMTLFIRCIAFLILFIVLLIVTGILGKILCRVFKHTPLQGLNGLLGAVLGLVKSAMWVLIFVTVIQFIANFNAESAAISQKTIEDTTIVEAIAEINPLVTTRDALMSQLGNFL